MTEPTNTWSEWSMYVIKNLEDINAALKIITEEQHSLEKDMAVLKTKIHRTYKFMGVAAGAIPVLIAVGYFLLRFML